MARQLRSDEYELIRHMLIVSNSELINRLSRDLMVEDMADGGMGSIRFVHATSEKMKREVCVAEALDKDGMLLSISINEDLAGRLMELDIWKVDFSPLMHFPAASELRSISAEGVTPQ